jgi:hypothetical protein
MFRQLIAALVVALCVGTGVTTAQTTQSQTDDTFIWHGELITADAVSGAVTVKTSLLSEAAGEAKNFKPGDRVLLSWSGVNQYAGSVRRIAKHDPAEKPEDFALPVELGSPVVQDNYVAFKFRASAAAIAAVKAVKPGEWITVTVRQRSSGDPQAIVSMTPYVKPASNT